MFGVWRAVQGRGEALPLPLPLLPPGHHLQGQGEEGGDPGGKLPQQCNLLQERNQYPQPSGLYTLIFFHLEAKYIPFLSAA